MYVCMYLFVYRRPAGAAQRDFTPGPHLPSSHTYIYTYMYMYIYIYIYTYVYIYIYTHVYVYTCLYIYMCHHTEVFSGTTPSPISHHHIIPTLLINLVPRHTSMCSPNLLTNIVGFRGFDSSTILIQRGGILMSIGDFPESLRQAILVGIMLVGRLGVDTPHFPISHHHTIPHLSVTRPSSRVSR